MKVVFIHSVRCTSTSTWVVWVSKQHSPPSLIETSVSTYNCVSNCILCFYQLWKFLIARLARSDPRNSFLACWPFAFFVDLLPFSCAIYSILVYFIMFWFQVLTCLRIVSIPIILNLNKFRQVWTCSDMFENPKNCNNQYHIESEQV